MLPLWMQGLGFGLALFGVSAVCWWAGALLLPLSVTAVLAGFLVMIDPDTGPAIKAEQGMAYAFSLHGGGLLALALHAAGIALGRKRTGGRLPWSPRTPDDDADLEGVERREGDRG